MGLVPGQVGQTGFERSTAGSERRARGRAAAWQPRRAWEVGLRALFDIVNGRWSQVRSAFAMAGNGLWDGGGGQLQGVMDWDVGCGGRVVCSEQVWMTVDELELYESLVLTGLYLMLCN